MTQDRQRQQATNDGPDLDGAATITLTPDELADMIRQQVAEATAGIKQATRPTSAQHEVPHNPHSAPAEETYEPPFIPKPEDWAEFNDAVARNLPAEEPVAQAGTILTVAPDGSTLECTPKAYRTLYAGRGYLAHAEDAKRGLAGSARAKRGRRRGGGNIVGEDPEQAAAPRRRRRRDDD